MIQTLDLARENAVLKDEVDRLRREMAQLARTNEAAPADAWARHGSSEVEAASHGPIDDPEATARLVLIMPRYRALDYGLFAGRFARVPDCEVVVDRRVIERRRGQAVRPPMERRRGERRRDGEDTAPALVVSVVPPEFERRR